MHTTLHTQTAHLLAYGGTYEPPGWVIAVVILFYIAIGALLFVVIRAIIRAIMRASRKK